MSVQLLVKWRKHGCFRFGFIPLRHKGVIVFAGEDADAVFEQLLEADVDVDDVEAEEGTITLPIDTIELIKPIAKPCSKKIRIQGLVPFEMFQLR